MSGSERSQKRLRRRGRDRRVVLVVCDVGRSGRPDLGTVDALARLQLAARRLGARVCLYRAGPDLRALLELVGLAEFLPCVGELRLEPRRESERREPAFGVEEEGDPADPVP